MDFKRYCLLLTLVIVAGLTGRLFPWPGVAAIAAPNEAEGFLKGPYLQNVRQDGITIMWETISEMNTKVGYGPDDSYGRERSVTGKRSIHEVTLDGLEVETLYHYRVISDDLVSDDHTFRTAPLRDTPFRFVVYGDNRTYPDTHAAVVQNIIAADPDIVINVGDVVTHGEIYSEWSDEFFTPAYDLMVDTPLYVAIGNHEDNAHWFYDFYSFPPPENYYSFDYGNSHFIILDTNANYSPGSDQYEWLKIDLESSESQEAENVFAFFHHPPYSSGDHESNLKAREAFHPLFRDYGVDVVFTGHVHNYERTYPIDDVIYIVTGGGGAGLYDIGRNSWTAYTEKSHHHCIVSVEGEEIAFEMIRIDGEVRDHLHLPPVPVEVNPEKIVAGKSFNVRFSVDTGRFEGVESAFLDLSPLGIAEGVWMRDDGVSGDEIAGDLIFTTTVGLSLPETLYGRKYLDIILEGPSMREIYATARLSVYPLEFYTYKDEFNPIWEISAVGLEYDEGYKGDLYGGETSLEISFPSTSQGLISFRYQIEEGLNLSGYGSLELYVKSSSAESEIIFQIAGRNFRIGGEEGVPLELGEWTRVEIPFDEMLFSGSNPSTMILFVRSVETIYIDEMRFVPVYTSVKESEELALSPKVYYLRQNFPNPFNPVTEIRYQLPEDSYVKLKIYDELGREVEVLVERFVEAGYHSVLWDTKDMASGVYFAKMEAGDFIAVRKMTLVR